MNTTDFKIVDAHAHYFPNRDVGRKVLEGIKKVFGATYFCTGTLPELAETMKRAGISHSVVLNNAAANRKSLNHLIGGNFSLCAQSLKHPEFIPAIGLDNRMRRNPVAEIEHKLKWGARAVKLHPVTQEFYVNDRAMWPIYRKCQAVDLPIIFHSGMMMVEGMPDYAHPELFYDVLRAFPDLRIVMAHMGGGFWEETTRLAAAFPDNLYFDTAITVSAAPVPDYLRLTDEQAVEMIRKIGVHRVMFGSDFPWINPRGDIERIKKLGLTEDEKRMILGDNAIKFFNI